MADMAIFTGTGAIFSNVVWAVSRFICGRYQQLDLVCMVNFECFLSLCQVCRLTFRPETPKNTVCRPHLRISKKEPNYFFEKSTIFWLHDEEKCQTACLYFRRCPFGRQKRTWDTWSQPTTYPHAHREIGQFSKIRFPSNTS